MTAGRTNGREGAENKENSERHDHRYQMRLYVLFAALMVLVSVVSATVLFTQRAQQQSVERLIGSFDLVDTLNDVHAAMVGAETGQRGFVITGDEQFLQPYHESVVRIDLLLKSLHHQGADDPETEGSADSISSTAKRALELIEQVVTTRRVQGAEPARKLVATQTVKREMDQLRNLIAEALEREKNRFSSIVSATRRYEQRAKLAIYSGGALGALALLSALWLTRRETLRRMTLQVSLERSNDELSTAAARTNALLAGREQLREFNEQLRGCHNTEEAEKAIVHGFKRVAPVSSGAVAVLNQSRVYLEVREEWGAQSPTKTVFDPEECLALRRGRPYWRTQPADGVPCWHLALEEAVPTLCYPLSAQNDSLGVLVLAGRELADIRIDDRRELVDYTAQTISAVLAPLRLQNALRRQAVQDPLTGLYNRRHMEAALERELARARRSGGELAVLMADIDHFKQYNDTFGHDAADAVLAGIAKLFTKGTRIEDVACRYGGEEFLIILPDIDVKTARKRAEHMRTGVQEFQPQFGGQTLKKVTISVGLAMYPNDGKNSSALVRAADGALYHAKRQGRNQVCMASSDPGEQPMSSSDRSI